MVSALLGGAFIGALGSAPFSCQLLSNGYPRDLNSRHSPAALGRRWTLLLFTFVFCVGGILQTIAGEGRGLGYIYSGRIIAGIGVGAICAVSPAYLSECAPRDIRGRVTGLFDISAATGVTLSYFVDCTYVQYAAWLFIVCVMSAKLMYLFWSDGISQHITEGAKVWRVPFSVQLIPGGLMAGIWHAFFSLLLYSQINHVLHSQWASSP